MAYMWISDHCRVTVRVRVSIRIADCCIQTAGESDKMRIYHVIKTDQWRAAPERSAPLHILSCPFYGHYVNMCRKVLYQVLNKQVLK